MVGILAYAGIAGALLAAFLRIVNPDQFTLVSSVFFLAAVVVGGRDCTLTACQQYPCADLRRNG